MKLTETYIHASNTNNADEFMSCFTEDAVVFDEGETHQGKKAIRQWFIDTKNKFAFNTEIVSTKEAAGEILLVGKVTGNFPGSPVNLKYSMKTKSGLIQSLKIAP